MRRFFYPSNAIAIVPFGVFDKGAIVKLMGSGNSPFKSMRVDDTKAIVLTPESGIATYKAILKHLKKAQKISL